ncbi:MAG: hypothetical protein QF536_10105, partial [Arenicellales bacterium]|nr:hypothetical protein [Arenicellales bacterium]
ILVLGYHKPSSRLSKSQNFCHPSVTPKEHRIMPKRNSFRLTDTYIRKSLRPPKTGRVELFDAQENNLCLRIVPRQRLWH